MEIPSSTSPRITIQVSPEPKAVKIPVVNARKLPPEEKLLLALESSTIMNLQFLQAIKGLSDNAKTQQEEQLPEFSSGPTIQPTPETFGVVV